MIEPDRWLDLGLIAALFHVVLAPATGIHALLFKRDARAAFGWIALCVLLPIAGPIVYLLLGINRIRRRAARLEWPEPRIGHERGRPSRREASPPERLDPALRELASIGDRLSRHSLVFGQSVEPLVNGDQAYPRMLDDIDGAVRSVFLSSYIFDSDAWVCASSSSWLAHGRAAPTSGSSSTVSASSTAGHASVGRSVAPEFPSPASCRPDCCPRSFP
jgi:hypothetical protein